MDFIRKIDARFADSALWQFVKFNLVSFSITAIQLLLANYLPVIFDRVNTPLPSFLSVFFDPEVLFSGESRYVVDGTVTWGYVAPFFLSNFIANVYGYFVNMKATFKGEGTKGGLIGYVAVLSFLILFSTWLQGVITPMLNGTGWQSSARTIAAMAAGTLQVSVLFPLEKFVLFRKREENGK